MASPGNQMLLKQHEPALSTAMISSSQLDDKKSVLPRIQFLSGFMLLLVKLQDLQ